ncbi:MAG TPA: YihY/virulence factor BrkB family protein [Thermoanaerobaculia bacterium]|nr:YihY/virulence factor BrkB family protein [Thermoanaerobaculia bacterium]
MTSLWTRGGLTWRELGVRLWRQIYEDELFGRCAELAYFFLFSIFPLLLFLTTLLGYLAGASTELRWNLLLYISRVSPSPEITRLISDTLNEITLGRGGAKLSISLLIALWVASNGMIAVSRTLNTACGLRETRRWWRRRLIAMALTIAFAVLIICALVLIFYGGESVDRLADRFGLGPFLPLLWRVFRWPLILTFVVISFEMIYNYAPNLGDSPSRQWWTPGAFTGVALFLLASFALRIYLAYFYIYSRAYGSLGAVILTLVWFYLIAFAILMGGEVNSEIAKEISRRKELEREAARARGEEVPEKPAKRRRFPGRRRAR